MTLTAGAQRERFGALTKAEGEQRSHDILPGGEVWVASTRQRRGEPKMRASFSKAPRVCERCKTPTLRAVQHHRYRGRDWVAFECARCGNSLVVTSDGAIEVGFLSSIGIGLALVPWVAAWRRCAPDDSTGELPSAEPQRGSEGGATGESVNGELQCAPWQVIPKEFAGYTLAGLLLFAIFFLPWVKMRRKMARNPIAGGAA